MKQIIDMLNIIKAVVNIKLQLRNDSHNFAYAAAEFSPNGL
jgi:hypothetical protein